MVKDSPSGSRLQEQRSSLNNFLSLSILEWLAYVLFSTLVLAILNVWTIWRLFFEEATAADSALLTDNLLKLEERLATPTLMLFWVIVGVVAYSIFWVLENVLLLAKTQIEESGYQRPQKPYWRSTLVSNSLLILAVLAWLAAVAFYLFSVAPTLAELFQEGLTSGSFSYRLSGILGAVAINTLAIYILLLLQRTLTLAWHLNRPAA